jgi:hypothetical protein
MTYSEAKFRRNDNNSSNCYDLWKTLARSGTSCSNASAMKKMIEADNLSFINILIRKIMQLSMILGDNKTVL